MTVCGDVPYDPSIPPDLRADTVILFWCHDPLRLENVTHIANDVWIPGDGEGEYRYRQDRILARGIVPLDWAGGMNRSDGTEEDLTAYYTGKLMTGYAGLAIDELGGYERSINEKFTAVLREVKQRFPDRFIAVWHAGLLTKEHIEAYRHGADLVMFERYIEGTEFLAPRLSYNLNMARNGGIIDKCIFALGIDENRWITTPEELEAQMRWIAENAPDMRGIAFFAPRAPDNLLLLADKLAGELY